jgi:next-to-BRCA1 protein 1
MATTNVPVTLDTPIVVKILFRGQTKKFKLPLKDLGAHVLPEKVRCSCIAVWGECQHDI